MDTHGFDFTPDNRRTYARSLDLATGPKGTPGSIRLRLSEMERDDPTILDIGVFVEPDAGEYRQNLAMEGWLSTQLLDDLIAALTLARDTAIVKGMIEPL